MKGCDGANKHWPQVPINIGFRAIRRGDECEVMFRFALSKPRRALAYGPNTRRTPTHLPRRERSLGRITLRPMRGCGGDGFGADSRPLGDDRVSGDYFRMARYSGAIPDGTRSTC